MPRAGSGTNIFPHMTHLIGAAALCRAALRPSGVVFAAFQARLCSRSTARTASGAQSGQYLWRPLATMYSFPHISQRSVLPIFLVFPAALRAWYFRSSSFFRSARHSGQYQARGPPGKVLPHDRQTLERMVLIFSVATQSGHFKAAGSPSKVIPHRWHIRSISLPGGPSHRGPDRWRLRSPAWSCAARRCRP